MDCLIYQNKLPGEYVLHSFQEVKSKKSGLRLERRGWYYHIRILKEMNDKIIQFNCKLDLLIQEYLSPFQERDPSIMRLKSHHPRHPERSKGRPQVILKGRKRTNLVLSPQVERFPNWSSLLLQYLPMGWKTGIRQQSLERGDHCCGWGGLERGDHCCGRGGLKRGYPDHSAWAATNPYSSASFLAARTASSSSYRNHTYKEAR